MIAVTVWVIAISALLADGTVIGASSLPDTWPTETKCMREAETQRVYITENHPEFQNLKVRCIPMRKLVEKDGSENG